ncbi:MAG: hypothetical protein ACQESN_10675 [Thermotogota bacterium]
MKLLLVGPYKKFNTNEYLELLADAYIKEGVEILFSEQNFLFSNFIPDAVHIQWPESMYRWQKLFSMDEKGLKFLEDRLTFYKKNKTTLIYTVHNLLPHDVANDFDKAVYNLIVSHADIIVHHGNSSIEIIKKHFPQTAHKTHIVAPHGPYKTQNLPKKDFARQKYALPLNKTVYTNFGKQRAYKGQDFCHEVFKKWNNHESCYFSIGELMKNAKTVSQQDDSFCNQYIYKKVSDNEIPEIITSTDVFFLGHNSGLNSGVLALALTYSKPVVFPDIGNFKDQVKGWDLYETYEVGNINSAINALNNMTSKLQKRHPKEDCNKEWLKLNSWEKHVENILRVI